MPEDVAGEVTEEPDGEFDDEFDGEIVGEIEDELEEAFAPGASGSCPLATRFDVRNLWRKVCSNRL